jgi:hypothetical protein
MNTMNTTKMNSRGEAFWIVDRAEKPFPFRASARWAVWDATRQVVVSEHKTRKAAMEALNSATA